MKGGPSFKEEVKASDFPKFDGSQKTFRVWLSKGDHWYHYSEVRRWRESLGRVSTFNFKGLATTWWAGLTYKQRMEKTQDWPTIREFVRKELMSIRWIKKEWQEFRALWFRQHRNEDETLVTTSNSVAKLVWQEMQKLSIQNAGSCQLFPSHMAEVEEDEEPMERPSLSVKSKGPTDKNLHKAPGKYPYPFTSNRSKNPPPQPCRNCGSNLHYDRDWDSWHKRDKKDSQKLPVNAANTAYEEAYISMLQGDDETCGFHCDMYYAAVDTLSTVEALLVQTTITLEDGEDMLNGTTEGIWNSLEANMAELESTNTPFEDIYQPEPIWQRPMGQAAKGIDAFKLLCHVNCLKEAATIVVGDSGAALTLISENFPKGLKWSKPKPRTGRKLELIQLTGSARRSEYVQLKLYFHSQFGPICLKGIEAYVVRNMTANLLIGEDTQLAWQLNTIWNNGKRFWQVGSSAHQIPTIAGSIPKEIFPVQRNPSNFDRKQRIRKQVAKTHSKWSVIAKQDMWIPPESIITVPITSTGAPTNESMFMEATSLDRGGDSFISTPHGLVILDGTNSSLVKMVNTTNKTILLRSGELIGQISRAEDSLKKTNQASKAELDLFTTKAAQLAALVPILNATPLTPEVNDIRLHVTEKAQSSENEETNWGPKTTDPGPDQIYPSDKLQEMIDVDLNLMSTQWEALYKIVEDNQVAFGFDGRLGHYKTKVHIELVPGTKHISAPPYHALPAKREVIDKQINLWLAQDIIKESKSPWGASVIIVYRNDKPRMCIDYCKMNKATIADQHPIPKQTDILAALSGAQYLSVFNECPFRVHAIGI